MKLQTLSRKELICLLFINDELLLAKLNKLQTTRNEIELDTLYLNIVINDKEFERPFLSNLLIITKNTSDIDCLTDFAYLIFTGYEIYCI